MRSPTSSRLISIPVSRLHLGNGARRPLTVDRRWVAPAGPSAVGVGVPAAGWGPGRIYKHESSVKVFISANLYPHSVKCGLRWT